MSNHKPLIRKKHTFTSLVSHLFSKITGSGKQPMEICIPKVTPYGKADFVSLLKEEDYRQKTLPSLTGPEIIEACKAENITGCGGAGFPMAVKLTAFGKAASPRKIMVINGVECDPGLHHDRWILENRFDQINDIVKLLMKAFNIDAVYLAVKGETAVHNTECIRIHRTPETYPAGEERRLIRCVLGSPLASLSPSDYPVDQGILVQNVQTLLNLYYALCGSSARQYFTALHLGNSQSSVVESPQNAAIQSTVDILWKTHEDIHLGGGIMHTRPAKDNDRLNSRINFVAHGKGAVFTEKECKKCRQCADYCPASLVPAPDLKDHTIHKEAHKCLECGTCAYVCPAGINLTAKMETLKMQPDHKMIG